MELWLKRDIFFLLDRFYEGANGQSNQDTWQLIVNDCVSIIINSNKIVEIFSSFWYQRH